MRAGRSYLGIVVVLANSTAMLVAVSAFAQVQSNAQQKCISTVNKGTAKVAIAQSKGQLRCLKAATKGGLPGAAEACLTADTKGKVQKAKNKNLSVYANKCAEIPDFGLAGAAAGNTAAVTELLELFHDIFGPDLDIAAINRSADPQGAKCQSKVAKASFRLSKAKILTFLRCKKFGLRIDLPPNSPQITDAAELAKCITSRPKSIAADPEGDIGAGLVTLANAVASSHCLGTNLPTAFPGACSGAVDFAGCVDERVECRVCLLLNAADAMSADCDLFDDGLANGSCGPGGPTTTTTNTTSTTSSTTTTTTTTTTATITTTTTSTTTTTTLYTPLLDHFKMYNSTGPDGPQVNLVDQFHVEDVDLGPVIWFSPPVDKNLEGIINPIDHLTCYDIPVGTFGPVQVEVNNQFAIQTLIVQNPLALCVPTEKSLGPLPPTPEILSRDHYKCYEAFGSPPGAPPVQLEDQFMSETVTLGPPIFFCNPVNKNGEGINDDLDHLTCYEIQPTPFGPLQANIRNQFHPQGATVDVTDPLALCVPSLKLQVLELVRCGIAEYPQCAGFCADPAIQHCIPNPNTPGECICCEPGGVPCP